MFDYEFYKKYNGDLISRNITTKIDLMKYHLKYGRKEGRLGSIKEFDNKYKTFNYLEYIKYNPDLKNLTEIELKIHYYKFHKTESRVANIFDLLKLCKNNLTLLPTQLIIANKSNHLINILIRTSNRLTFHKCITSVLNQTYKNIKIHVCYDDIASLKYLVDYDISYFHVIKNNDPYGYNLYCNDLMNKVNDGYVMFLDDDDMLTHNNCLEYIASHIDDKTILVWKFMRPDKIIFPQDINNINYGEITSCGFLFHHTLKQNTKWIDKQGSDYYFFNQMAKSNIKFLNEILTKTTYLDKISSFGSNNFIDFDFYRRNNMDLIDLDEFQLVEHYYKHGINENRIVESLTFNIKLISKTILTNKNTIIYLIDKSLEQVTSGYTIKSDHTIRLLKKIFNVIVVVKPSNYKNVDSTIIYLNNKSHNNIDNNFLQIYYDELCNVILKYKPFLIISCSNFINGYIGNLVGKSFNIRTVYEVRGLWEITQESLCPKYCETFLYKQSVLYEIKTCNESDQVWVINKELKSELVKRNINKNKIKVIPFYVYDGVFNEIKIGRPKNIGFCGTCTKYENLETLLTLSKLIKQRGLDFKINICGNNSEWLKKLVDNDVINIFDNVPYDEINNFIKEQDIMIITRKQSKVSNMVLPMKILDYIHYNKIIVSTNIKPIKTILKSKATYYETLEDLIDLITRVKYKNLSKLKVDKYTSFIKTNLLINNIVVHNF